MGSVTGNWSQERRAQHGQGGSCCAAVTKQSTALSQVELVGQGSCNVPVNQGVPNLSRTHGFSGVDVSFCSTWCSPSGS